MGPDQAPWFVDLFAGCGGFSRGFLDAGFRHLIANEIWPTAVETYERNNGPDIVCGDINDTAVFSQLVDATLAHEPLVVIGGPPCQGFSMAGNRNPVDPRGQLWKKFVEFVNKTKPVAFVMENVKGIISMKHLDENISVAKNAELQEIAGSMQRIKDLRRYARQRALAEEEKKELDKLEKLQKKSAKKVSNYLVPLLPKIISGLESSGPGYVVQHKILNAANYGVAQLRERFIAIGIRIDMFEKIKEKNGKDVLFHPLPQYLDMLENQGPKIPKQFKNYINSESTFKPFVTVREAIGDLADVPEESIPNHVFMKHRPDFIKRIAATKPGDTVFPSYTDGWYRLLPDRPSRTVKENHGGVHCHPWLPRTLTPRELARLQSFPDSFAFSGKKSEVWVQIGNAVPPLLGKAIAEKLIDLFRDL